MATRQEITIRELSEADAGAVSRLSRQLGYQLSVEETANHIRWIMKNPENCAFAALIDNKVAGWIHGFQAIRLESKPFVEIGGLVVDEAYRGKGIGKMLVHKVKEWCKEKDVRTLRLRTNVKRTEAHQFYRAIGFRETKQQKIFEMEIE